jgi:K+/H+ antiporter YhaU regulatory subunit KhtT
MKYVEKLNAVTRNLEKCERVTMHTTKEENQADTLANALIDIEVAMENISREIPKFYLEDLTSDEVDDLILELGEELRQILYHIEDSRVYDYLRSTKQ